MFICRGSVAIYIFLVDLVPELMDWLKMSQMRWKVEVVLSAEISVVFILLSHSGV